MEASSGPSAENPRDPVQQELALGDRSSHLAYVDGPWQIELIYRLSLNTLTTLLAIVSRWAVDRLSTRLLGNLDWSLEIVVWTFRVSVLIVVIVGVVWDLGAFVLRRIPGAWKRQILSWRSEK